MRSCLAVSKATLANTGQYVCHVHESVQDQRATANVNITVLGEKETGRDSLKTNYDWIAYYYGSFLD